MIPHSSYYRKLKRCSVAYDRVEVSLILPCLPNYVHVLRTTFTPEAGSQINWPIMDNDDVIRNVCQIEKAIILVQFMQDVDAKHVLSFGL